MTAPSRVPIVAAVHPQPDLLSEVLSDLHLRCMVPGASRLSAPWGVSYGLARGQANGPSIPRVRGAFLVVLSGSCELLLPEEALSLRLAAGDVVLITRPPPHVLRDRPGSPVVPVREMLSAEEMRQRAGLRGGGGGAETHFFNGGLSLEDPEDAALLERLPPMIHLPATDAQQPHEDLAATITLLAHELARRRPGTDGILNHLTHVLLMQILRAYLGQDRPEEPANWLLALRDPQIGDVLGLMHQQPEKPWSVASLAAAVAMSRSALAERFERVTRQTPMRYLLVLRMRRARTWLRQTDLAMGRIAERSGYASESSFCNAFKRQVGLSPRAFRRQDRSNDLPAV